MRIIFRALLLAAVLVPVCAIAAKFQAFRPGGQTVLIAATTTATAVTLQGAGGSLLVSHMHGARAH
jgi:hypothetical protein